MPELRETVLKLAYDNPDLRADLLPLVESERTAGVLDKLWNSYRKTHPESKKPPKSLIDKARDLADKAKGKVQEVADKVQGRPTKKDLDKKLQDQKEKSKKDEGGFSDFDPKKTKEREESDKKLREKSKQEGEARKEQQKKEKPVWEGKKPEFGKDKKPEKKPESGKGKDNEDFIKSELSHPDKRVRDFAKQKYRQARLRTAGANSLLHDIIRLAHSNPNLRPHLMPLVYDYLDNE